MHTSHRRTTALASLALVLAPVLSSCGFDYATDRNYTPSVGANDRDGQVDVLNGVIVAAETGEAVFLASLANNSTEDESTFEAISSPDGLTFEGLEPITLAPEGFVNLAKSETPPITVEGDFEVGQFVPVTLEFSHGESAELNVPVMPNCDEFSDIPGVPAGDGACEPDAPEDH